MVVPSPSLATKYFQSLNSVELDSWPLAARDDVCAHPPVYPRMGGAQRYPSRRRIISKQGGGFRKCSTHPSYYEPRALLLRLAEQCCLRSAKKQRTSLLTVVPVVPSTAGSISGPVLIVGLLVVGISRFLAAEGSRTAFSRVVGVAELLARGCGRTVRLANVIIRRCRHLTRRSGNQQRAENSQNCLSHFYLR